MTDQSDQPPVSDPYKRNQSSTSNSDLDPPPPDPHNAAEDEPTLQLVQQLQDLDFKEPADEQPDGRDSNDEEEEDSKSEESDKNDNGDEDETAIAGEGGDVDKMNERRRYLYPLRPQAEDCAFYMKTGSCKFGANCKFNHPVRRKKEVSKEKVKEGEEQAEKPGQTECKYYLRTGGCKYGKACRYNHSKAKTSVASVLELNFLGLPIRQGEKECPYYMRNGSCKYGANCKFNHPDPTAVGGGDPSGYNNGGSVSSPAPSQVSIGSWSSPRPLNETGPFIPMIFSPTHAVPSQNPEWNGYQAPVYPPERSMHPPTAYLMNNPTTEASVYTHHQPQKLVDEFPERPGQPECSYFLKTGDCKFKSNCKYHHPKNRTVKTPSCALSDKGLPLRPDQNVCTHYSRYGICKFGPACKFDHPIQPPSSIVSAVDQAAQFSGSQTTAEEVKVTADGNGSDASIQQHV
ncbi:LOW QUALITY PROTEIN: zinc finger CCCH domain-containing protein 67 [Carica papaya]|uniref:LOW QUALITY PROTEIN: zinc finger CCCH domain-containing protein 67 n=1 Tax=Carica papaya TaxID=3649 RepID=UPI000B8C88AD|nr:LOW QUALITY PROTEIN: zinc finger CCCH domain-containing protein 67 [Carica papaya]